MDPVPRRPGVYRGPVAEPRGGRGRAGQVRLQDGHPPAGRVQAEGGLAARRQDDRVPPLRQVRVQEGQEQTHPGDQKQQHGRRRALHVHGHRRHRHGHVERASHGQG